MDRFLAHFRGVPTLNPPTTGSMPPKRSKFRVRVGKPPFQTPDDSPRRFDSIQKGWPVQLHSVRQHRGHNSAQSDDHHVDWHMVQRAEFSGITVRWHHVGRDQLALNCLAHDVANSVRRSLIDAHVEPALEAQSAEHPSDLLKIPEPKPVENNTFSRKKKKKIRD